MQFGLTEKYLSAWELSLPTEVAKTKTSWISKVICNKSPAILKVLTPIGKEFEASSSQILHCFAGRGPVRILQFDE